MDTQHPHHDFAMAWDKYMDIAAVVFVGLAVLTFLYYEFRLLQVKDYKEKYDFVNRNEIMYFWYSVILLILSAFFLSQGFSTEKIMDIGMIWFYVRMFLSVSFTIIAYFIFNTIVKIYYPKSVEKRLKKIRKIPRISSAGNQMRKLREEEEAAHLEASQEAEQRSGIHSVDYDVWLDEKTGEKKVEKYFSYEHVEECPECGYVTLRIDYEEVTAQPTEWMDGLLVKHYKCTYCGHRERQERVLAKTSTNT